MPPEDGFLKGPIDQSDDVSTSSDQQLTARERDVMQQLIEGKTDKEIASDLGISHYTASTHVKRILGKLKVSTRSAAISKALREPQVLENLE